MKILRLQAENIKRLSVVDIKPDGAIVELAGKNGNGKTSVLDAILWALGGERPIQFKPIRKGCDQGHTILHLGTEAEGLKLIVTRTYTRAGDTGEGFTTKLKVENPDGLKGGQELLNAIVGQLSFDPTEFQRIKPAERVALLKRFVPGVDFDALAAKRAKLVEERKDKGREVKRLAALITPPADLESIPDDEVDVAGLSRQIETAQDAAFRVTEANKRRLHDIWLAEQAIAEQEDVIAEICKEIADLESRLAALKTRRALAEDGKQVDIDGLAIAEAVPVQQYPESNTAALRDQIATANDVNRRVAAKRDWSKSKADHALAVADHSALDLQIDGIDESVVKAVEGAKLPVRGLSLGEEDVMLDGLPFNQASDAQQLRTSTAIAMAMNPKLRVIRIRNGGLLDEDAFAILKDVATADDYQIWLESVIPHEPGAIVMEDGHVQ